jgi:pilus assembly protein CpaF
VTANYRTQDLFVRTNHQVDARGEILSDLVPTGILPRALSQLHEHGVDLPESVYEAARRTRARDRG